MSKCTLNRPTSPQSRSQGGAFYSSDFSPFRGTVGHTVKRKPYIVPFVSSLFFTGRPLTVVWGVVSLIINTVNRMFFGGSITHIRQEVLKLTPSIAHGNSPAAITRVRFIIGICAALNNMRPRSVFRSASKSMRSFFRFINLQTATGLRRTIGKAGAVYNNIRTALTFAKPSESAVFIPLNRYKSNESTEYQTSNIESIWMKFNRSISHILFPSVVTVHCTGDTV